MLNEKIANLDHKIAELKAQKEALEQKQSQHLLSLLKRAGAYKLDQELLLGAIASAEAAMRNSDQQQIQNFRSLGQKFFPKRTNSAQDQS